MKRAPLALVIFALAALPAAADNAAIGWSPDGRSIVVAEPGRTRIIDASTRETILQGAGVGTPRTIAVSAAGRVAVLDPVANEIAFLRNGIDRARVAESPIDALWRGETLFVLSRDGAALTRFDGSGSERLDLGADPSLMRDTREGIVIYSQSTGEVTVIDSSALRILRRALLPPSASDLESDGTHIYMTYPREGLVIAARLRDLAVVERLRVGSVPVDAAIEGRTSAISAARLSVADPSSKRIWRIEATQSPFAAFGRAFLRSLIGLRIIKPDSSAAPTGVDRIWAGGKSRFALDSSSGALFRIEGTSLKAIASGIAPHAIDVSDDGRAAFWTGDGLSIVR